MNTNENDTVTKKTHHVIPAKDGGWSVKKGGGERASRSFDNKEDAVKYGRALSRNAGSEFFIHKKDGTIQSKDSYGKDPYPPTDRR
jgi:hypothetical protein